MKFEEFLAEQMSTHTKDGLKFELGETSAKIEFFNQISDYHLFSQIYDDNKLSLSSDGVRYGFKLSAESAGAILAKSSPRKYISSEIARYIAVDSMLESSMSRAGIAIGTRSIKKKGAEIHLEIYKKYDRSNTLGTVILRNKGLVDIEIKIGKQFKKIDINKHLFLTNRDQFLEYVKEAIGL